MKPNNQDINVSLINDFTSGALVTTTLDIMEKPISQSVADDTVTDRLKFTTISDKVTSHGRVVKAPTRLIETVLLYLLGLCYLATHGTFTVWLL